MYRELFSLFVFRAVVVALVFLVCFYYFDLYDQSVIPKFSDHMLEVIQAFGFGCILLALIYYLFPFLTISTRIFWSGIIAVGVAIFSWRFFYFKVLERGLFTTPVAVVGTGRAAGEIVSAINGKKDSGFRIVALVGNGKPDFVPPGIPVFPDVKDLSRLCSQRKIERIILAPDDKRGLAMHDFIQFKLMGIEVNDVVRFYEDLTGKIMVERVNPSWMLFSDGFYVSVVKRGVKRIMDISAASILLLLALPVFLLSAVVIKLESTGDIFYRQERVGRNGKVFMVVKFRSMRADAEKDGPVWAETRDDRVTRFGHFLRKYRIDELPQLINVLKGDMSFVGPRPERPVFVSELEKNIPFYGIRHVVKPGITGWAQIYYPYGASEQDALRKLEYDLYYIKNLSIGMDLSTIFQTIKVVLLGRGAR